MNYQTIELTLDSQGVAELVLNRPQVHNAFGDQTIAELLHALNHLAEQPQLRLLVLRSNGKNFSAGADLNWMRAMAEKNYQQNLDDAGGLGKLMAKLDSFPPPNLA